MAKVKSSGGEVVANQVFLAIPWRTVRPRYESIVARLKTKSPLSFVIVGREDDQDAEDLFDVIKQRLDSSSYAIFDASGGNANVSLEYGYAEANDIPRIIYFSTHGRARSSSADVPIIADLAGKRRNQYKQVSALAGLLENFSKRHPYTVRFERFLSNTFRRFKRGKKRRARSLALKVLHCLDGARHVRRADIVHQLQADISDYSPEEIDDMIKKLNTAKLISSQRGRYSRVEVR